MYLWVTEEPVGFVIKKSKNAGSEGLLGSHFLVITPQRGWVALSHHPAESGREVGLCSVFIPNRCGGFPPLLLF